MKNYKEMAKFVIEALDKLGCPPLTVAMAGSKGNLEKSYKLLTENPKITLEEFLKEMKLETE